MKIEIKNQQTKNKLLEYEEEFWTGKRTIKYDGITLSKIKRNTFEYKNKEEIEKFFVKGNQLFGVTLQMFGETIEIERKITGYEIVLSIMVFLPCVLFGLIGGIFGGIFGATNLLLIKKFDKWYFKVIISILFLAIGMLLSYIFAVLVFKIMFSYL